MLNGANENTVARFRADMRDQQQQAPGLVPPQHSARPPPFTEM